MKDTLPHSPDNSPEPKVKEKSEEKKESLVDFAKKLTGIFKTKKKSFEPMFFVMHYYYYKTNGQRWMGIEGNSFFAKY